jgi:hypothetical protein
VLEADARTVQLNRAQSVQTNDHARLIKTCRVASYPMHLPFTVMAVERR